MLYDISSIHDSYQLWRVNYSAAAKQRNGPRDRPFEDRSGEWKRIENLRILGRIKAQGFTEAARASAGWDRCPILRKPAHERR